MSKGFLYDEGDELITRKEDVGGLPDTSEASAGDVLSLDSDKEPVWSAPSGGGGGGGVIFTIDVEHPIEAEIGGQTMTLYKTNKTWAEFYGAFTSGSNLVEFNSDHTYSYAVVVNDLSVEGIGLLQLVKNGDVTNMYVEYDGFACQIDEQINN